MSSQISLHDKPKAFAQPGQENVQQLFDCGGSRPQTEIAPLPAPNGSLDNSRKRPAEENSPRSEANGHHKRHKAQEAISDGTVTEEANNAGEGPKTTSLQGEASNSALPTIVVKTADAHKSVEDTITVVVEQLQIGAVYCPHTPPRRRSPAKRTSPPKTPSRKPKKKQQKSSQKSKSLRKKSTQKKASGTPRRRSLRAPQETPSKVVPRPDVPVGDELFLSRLPLEVRQCIYRHLLRARGPIQVLNGWSQLCRRQQPAPALYPAVLAVCRQVFDEAVRVLYGENEFRYLVRDQAKVVELGGGDVFSSARTIAVRKYAPYFRRLELRMERNRTAPEYGGALARAVGVLKDNGADLYRLTIDISPVMAKDGSVSMTWWFIQDGPVNAALKALKTCSVQIHVFTVKTDFETDSDGDSDGDTNADTDGDTDTLKSLRCTIDKRSEVNELDVIRRVSQQRKPGQHKSSEEIERIKRDMRLRIQAEQADTADRQLDWLGPRINNACRDPERAVQLRWFEEFQTTPERRMEIITDQLPGYARWETVDNSDDADYTNEDSHDLESEDEDFSY